jgi:hypothetical protein
MVWAVTNVALKEAIVRRNEHAAASLAKSVTAGKRLRTDAPVSSMTLLRQRKLTSLHEDEQMIRDE